MTDDNTMQERPRNAADAIAADIGATTAPGRAAIAGDLPPRSNGAQPPDETARISTLTSDAIVASGLAVAADIRAMGVQARQEADAIEREAEMVAVSIIEATQGLATRVGRYIDDLKHAKDAVRSHGQTLASAPTFMDHVETRRALEAKQTPPAHQD